jgi:hypothetical protein
MGAILDVTEMLKEPEGMAIAAVWRSKKKCAKH